MWAIIWREFKLHYTKPYWLISNFASPLFYLLFFGILLSAAVPRVTLYEKSFEYLHFFIPGLIVMQSFFILSYTIALVNLDRRLGIIEMIQSTVTHFNEYIWGRAISVQFLIYGKIILIWLIALIFFKFNVTQIAYIIFIILILFVVNLFWFNIGFILGLLIKTEDIRDILLQLITLPLTFLSNIYYPTNNAPGILKFIITINPLTHTTNLVRPMLLNINIINFFSIGVLVIYLLVSFILISLVTKDFLLINNE